MTENKKLHTRLLCVYMWNAAALRDMFKFEESHRHHPICVSVYIRSERLLRLFVCIYVFTSPIVKVFVCGLFECVWCGYWVMKIPTTILTASAVKLV